MTDMERLADKLSRGPNGQAKYEIIKDFLVEELAEGNFAEGQLLPSETVMVEALGVARNTVRQAISELQEDGVVERIQGKGTYFKIKANEKPSQQSGLFGLILPELSRGLYPLLARGFDNGARSGHHQMVVCNSGFNISEQGNIILQLIDKKVAGVALVPALSPPTPPFHIRHLNEVGIPVVYCHRGVSDVTAPLVTWDPEEIGRMAGQAFLAQGHVNVAYFARYRYVHTERQERGFRKILGDHGVDLSEDRVYYGASLDHTPGEIDLKSQVLKTLLTGNDPVTAIFCNDDDEAELVHHLVMNMGYHVPGDLSLIGFGDTLARSGVFRSQLTSVTVNEFDLGARAAAVLHEMRDGDRPLNSDETIHLPISLVKGRTLGPVPSRSTSG
jgi:DNA-binding LacI/PurR family transcriptional regulator